MKKLGLTLLAGLVSTSVFAAPVGTTFTGFGVGLDLTTTKYEDAKRATGVGIVADYGFDFGNNFIGLAEGKIKFNKSKLLDRRNGDNYARLDEKWRANLSYLQGYRVLPDLLPYVKVSYNVAKLESDVKEVVRDRTYSSHKEDTGNGLGLGIGVKYAVSSNFEVGAEYLRSRTKFDGDRVNANTFGANATYRF
ncbi:porin family protein [Otariodibacter oris]|uniref:Outer membrane autotransporter protein n=1 Tax=Otariodibacter oris TaxID=1032623 RepID=A0A420XGH6_9PAST|nr:porin family protein [Otariodibacter oris]QGM80081.1 hypothetical protein A6A10_00980 [Otariodibacter oris]RKR71908.1 outer membrane autotransporter protein [Otariodibacter oris]